jgi:TRAP-type C4-dicarboxylate transport system substrate-binding protein
MPNLIHARAGTTSRSPRLSPVIFLTGVLILAAGARAAEVIPLTAVDAYAPTASWVRLFIDYYIPEVDRRLAATGRYRIKWNKAFGGTIAKTRGVLDALKYDLADIGIVTTPFYPDKVPYYNLAYVTPFVTTDIGLVARTISELADRYPEIKRVWDDHHQVYVTTTGMIDTYQVLLAERPGSLLDLKGRKIGGVGLNLRYLAGLEATGVTSTLNDWYNSLATGLLDGVVAWSEAAIDYKLYEVAPYMLDVRLGAVTSMVVSVNRRTYDRLPEEVRETLIAAARDYRDVLARETDRMGARSRAEFQRLGGTLIELSEAERRQWVARIPNMAQEWAADLERRGLPGRQILKDYMDIMRAHNQPILRHWDRE